ncbi:MAG: sigma-70 family RNA polymerase sigma factor [Moraxellaceae bacterium]|nr:sigma-70 family RNA polymerase sigma factor [Moraxellaceae bacterium]
MPIQQDIVAEIPRLRRFARALTGDAYRADDLVQDTLERALNKWMLWRPGNLRAWLLTIMHHVFISQARSHKTVEYYPEEMLPEVSARGAQDEGLALRDLDRALARLSLDQRQVLLLVTLEELSYEETARVLNIPVGTVMSRLYRARERLRALLASQDGSAHLRIVK